MNRVGGQTASCDKQCDATLVIEKGTESAWALEWAGWQAIEVRGPRGPEVHTYCPVHHVCDASKGTHVMPHQNCILR